MRRSLLVSGGIVRIGVALLLLSGGPALAQEPALSLPVDCTLGQDCFLQQTVDAAPGAEAADYRCGHLTYDGHTGSDFRVPPGIEVPVTAVADGRVLRTRDGEPDRRFAEPLRVSGGRDCGNGAIVAHEGGLQTQYCHLARGSVRVSPGDVVERGDEIGLVGASGRVDFPHVELIVRRDGEVVDPFTGLPPGSGCGLSVAPLWSETAIDRLADVDRTQVVAAGFHTAAVTIPMVEDGETAAPSGGTIAAGADALVAYGLAMAVEEGDAHRLVLTGPGLDMDETDRIDSDRAQEMRFVGRRFEEGLAPGTYRMRYEILRGGEVVDAAQAVLRAR